MLKHVVASVVKRGARSARTTVCASQWRRVRTPDLAANAVTARHTRKPRVDPLPYFVETQCPRRVRDIIPAALWLGFASLLGAKYPKATLSARGRAAVRGQARRAQSRLLNALQRVKCSITSRKPGKRAVSSERVGILKSAKSKPGATVQPTSAKPRQSRGTTKPHYLGDLWLLASYYRSTPSSAHVHRTDRLRLSCATLDWRPGSGADLVAAHASGQCRRSPACNKK